MIKTTERHKTKRSFWTSPVEASNILQNDHVKGEVATISVGYGEAISNYEAVGLIEIQQTNRSIGIENIKGKQKNKCANSNETKTLTAYLSRRKGHVEWIIYDKIMLNVKTNTNIFSVKYIFYNNIKQLSVLFTIFSKITDILTMKCEIESKYSAWFYIYIVDNHLLKQLSFPFKNHKLGSSGALTFLSHETIDTKTSVIDEISTAVLTRGLICVDIADLKAVMSNKVSIALSISCHLEHAITELNKLIESKYNALSTTTGLFMIFSFEKNYSDAIFDIDEMAMRIKEIVPTESRLFFCANMNRNARQDFKLTIIMNT
jgi:hypothetical protein